MSKDTFLTQYNSPNIVIVPAKSLNDDPSQKSLSKADSKSPTDPGNDPPTDDTNKSIPILIQGTTSTSESCTDLTLNTNMNATNKSWASNYMHSIGLPYEKSILNRRGKMNTSQDFITQEPPPAGGGPHMQYANVNAQTAAQNNNYAFGQSSSILGNNYNNIVSNTVVMPTTSYPGSYENINYYYSQPMNAVESGCCSTCYSSVGNQPTTYSQHSNGINNTSAMVTYYDPNATSTMAPAMNLPYTESSAYNTYTITNFGQPVKPNISENNTSSSITPCVDNRCPTPLFDEISLMPQLDTCVHANSSLTKITDVKSYRMDDEKSSVSNSNSVLEEKTCDCLCSKRNPDAPNNPNTEIQINTDKKLEQVSSVQANEKAFRDFLRKLKIDRPSVKEKKVTPTLLKSPPTLKKVKKTKSKSKEKSSVLENEKAFRKLLQKLKMERKTKAEKSDNKRVITKNTSSKDQTSSHEKSMNCSENKSSKESKQKIEDRPKFIKTKYVDEQEPEYKPIKKARLDSKYELEKTKNKIITNKYIDEQEAVYKPLKKSRLDSLENKRYSSVKSKSTKDLEEQEPAYKPIKKTKSVSDYEQKKYSNTKTIPTKYVDEQEPEYKPIKKQSDYELKKYSNTKTISTKYVDDKKQEYKQIKKTRIDSSSDLSKRHTTKLDSTNFKIKKSRDESDTLDKLCKKYDNDYNIRTYKTESTKYYKYRAEDCQDTHKQSPVKSVVKKSETRELKKSPLYNVIDKEDLRDKLSRKLPTKIKGRKEETFNTKSSGESNDNLIITVNNNMSKNQFSPVNNTDNLKTKTESSKTINLVINIVYKQPGLRSESDKSDSDSPQGNADLSFLDDFNVDEIVASLNKNERINTNQNAQTEASNNTDTSNVFIKTENSEMILEKGDRLNNLLSKEANLLANHRNIHEEIQSEKRSCMGNERKKLLPQEQSELPQKEDKCVADSVLNNIDEEDKRKHSDLIKILEGTKDEKQIIQAQTNSEIQTAHVLDNVSNEIYMFDNDITSFDEEDKRRQSELLKILEDTKEDETEVIQTQTNDITQTAYVLDKISNDMNSYEDDITSFVEEDNRRQSEVLKILEDTNEDEKQITQTQNNSKPQTVHILDDVTNEICMYDDDITSFDEEDKRRQSELLKILADTKENDTEVIQTQTNMSQTAYSLDKVSDHILEDTRTENKVIKGQTNSLHRIIDKVSNVLTIIDLSNDDSNDSYNTKQSKETSLDDVYIVEEKTGKNLIETIDLTLVDNSSNRLSTQSLVTPEVLNKKAKRVSSYPRVKENILLDKHKSMNKGVGKREMTNETIAKNISSKKMLVQQVEEQKTGAYLDNNKCKNSGTETVTKIVSLIRDAIDSLKTSETLNNAVDKLNVDDKVKEVLNSQDVIKQSQSDNQPSDKSMSIGMENESSTPKIFETMDCKQSQEENSASVTNSEITDCDANKDHIKLKDDAVVELLSNNINTINGTISDAVNNTKIEEELSQQAEVEVKNEKSSSTDIKCENSVTKIPIEDCNTSQTTEKNANQKISEITSCNKQMVVTNVVPQIIESKPEVNIDEKKNTFEESKSPKAKVQNKTEASSSKTMPSTAGTKINTPSPAIKIDNNNLNAFDVNVENANNKTHIRSKNINTSIIAGKLEREMFECFNQKYFAQDIIHSGTFSKVFRFSSYSGRQYAVKSYNAWQSLYKYAEKKDLLFSMQEGLMRNNYGCVFLINTFSMQGRLCLLMDYYPKNLKQALEENEKPFHINVVRHLSSQLVSAVMQLKSHDVVHLDIKPTHILLNYKNDRLKLCGFDTAQYINKIPVLPNLGTVNYRPPEVIIGYKIGFDVDVWATAVVMYEMATGIKLFPGSFNNDILYKQMCTLGPLPVEMIHRSHYSNAHFAGTSFKMRVRKKNGPHDIKIITKFYKTKRLETTIFKAYNVNLRSTATKQELIADNKKLLSFTALLRNMLEVDPGDRMPIQFVSTHSFITDEIVVHFQENSLAVAGTL